MFKRNIAMLVLFTALFVTASYVWAGGNKAKDPLSGSDITIGHWWEDYDAFTRTGSNDFEERTIDYRRKIQNDHNFRIREKNVGTYSNIQQLITMSIMTDEPLADVFLLEASWAKVLQNRGLLYPVSSSKTFDFNQPPFSRAVKNAFTRDGETYAFGMNVGVMTYPMLVYFNKRLFREAGIDPELPYNMQRDGTWTWENFVALSKRLTRDIDNDGIIDIYAMCQDSNLEMHNAIISSNGANYVEIDPLTGKFISAITTPEFLEALNFARRLVDEGVLKPPPEPRNWDWYKSEFIDGRVAMHVEPVWVALTELQAMRDEFGAVVFPKGPKVNEYPIFRDELIYVIPNTSKATPEKADSIIRGVQLWEAPFDNSPNAWKESYFNVFRDSRSIDETMEILRNPKLIKYKYHLWVPGLNIGDIVFQNWVTDLTSAQLIESVVPIWDAIINDANESW